MSQKTLAGTPNVRYPDPLVKRVNPDGTQPYSSYYALVVWKEPGTNNYFPILSKTNGQLLMELLLFGSDYPAKISGAQFFANETYSSTGTINPISDLSFPLYPPPFTGSMDGAPSIIPVSANPAYTTPYKKILTGKTATNGLTVSGFPALTLLFSHNLWASGAGDAGDAADYGVVLDVVNNGAVVDGPGSYFPAVNFSPPVARVPVILYEPDFTQSIIDNGYIIENANLSLGIQSTLDVVGLWGNSDYSPYPPQGARNAAPMNAAPPLFSAAFSALDKYRKNK